MFDLSLLGERTIQIDCDVIQADGGLPAPPPSPAPHWRRRTRSTLLAAEARSPASPITGAVARVRRHGAGPPLLDLEYVEDVDCDTDMNVVMTGAATTWRWGTAEGAAFRAARWISCCPWPKSGHCRTGAAAAGITTYQ